MLFCCQDATVEVSLGGITIKNQFIMDLPPGLEEFLENCDLINTVEVKCHQYTCTYTHTNTMRYNCLHSGALELFLDFCATEEIKIV